MQKIFISSVIQGFSAERAAARKAVESLRQIPIMAEDFGAKPYSPKLACLTEVRRCSVFICILGQRYGYITPNKKSVTEEEFEEARKNGLSILCFVRNGPLDDNQEAFVSRVKNYEAGYFTAFFENPEDLQCKITTALYDLLGQNDITTLTSSEAASHVLRYVKKNWPSTDTHLFAVIFPARQGETYLSPIDMSRKPVQSQLTQLATSETTRVLREGPSVIVQEGEEHFALSQGAHGKNLASVEFHANGTLIWDIALHNGDRSNFSLVKMFVIDEEEIAQLLKHFLAFAGHYYGTLEASSHLSSFYVAVGFHGVGQKQFGQYPAGRTYVHSMPISMNNIDDPLLIPPKPYKIARADLANPKRLAEVIISLVVRTFKAKDRYFTPNTV